MAITVQAQPQPDTPCFNNQYFTLSSTNSGQANFRYVIDVTIDSETTRVKINPDPNSKAHFNPQKIAESYIANTFDPDQDQIYPSTDSIKSVQIETYEEYGSPPSVGSLETDDTYYVWNAVYSPYEFLNYPSVYGAATQALNLNRCPVTTVASPVTFSTRLNKALYTQDNIIMSWHRAFGGVEFGYLRLICYDSSGSTLQSTWITNNYATVGSNYERNLVYFNCSPSSTASLLTNHAADVSRSDTGLPVIPTNTVWMKAEPYNNGKSVITGEVLWIKFEDYCDKYDKYVVHFLNRLGTYDFFVFDKVSRTTSTKETNTYKKSPYYENSSNLYTYLPYSSVTQHYSTIITDKLELNSNWITEDESTWLKQLVNSPHIIIEDGDGNLYSAKCTDTTYESKKDVNDKLYNLTVNLEYDYQDVSQFG